MRCSILSKSEMTQLDFGHLLLSPEFYLQDKIDCWTFLEKKATCSLDFYFDSISETITSISKVAVCYDLTDGLPKFFDEGTKTHSIRSTKKVARAGDFAISRLRSYLEEMGIVEDRKEKQLFSTEFLIFRPITDQLSVHTLFALCMTHRVQKIFNLGQYGTEHPRFYEFLLSQLPVPDALKSIDSNVSQIVQKALKLRLLSREKYFEAQSILLTELELHNCLLLHQLVFTNDFSNIRKHSRMDSEYFQPKYGEIVDKIKRYIGGWDRLENLAQITTKKFQPKSEQSYKYIELSNVGSFGEITGCIVEKGKNLPTRARRKVFEGDLLISSVEGSLDSVACIDSEFNQAICSTGFHVLHSRVINSETLLVLMKSIAGQLQLKRGCSGTILTAINEEELAHIAIPKIRNQIQAEIRHKICESEQARKQARLLLNLAKQTVEMAIESNANMAIEWLKSQDCEYLLTSQEVCLH